MSWKNRPLIGLSTALILKVIWRAAARATTDGFVLRLVAVVLPVGAGDGVLSDDPGVLDAALLAAVVLGAALLGCALPEAALPEELGPDGGCGVADSGEGVGDTGGSATAGAVETARPTMAPTRTARGRRCMCT